MFDPQTVQLLDTLPPIGELDAELARSRLTAAYLELTRMRVNAGTNPVVIVEQLRQMANGLELFCLLESARENKVTESGRAAAFIAAQSLELLTDLMTKVPVNETPRHLLENPQVFSRLEAGLLYLIAGYYANARALGVEVSDDAEQLPQDYYQLRRVIARVAECVNRFETTCF